MSQSDVQRHFASDARIYQFSHRRRDILADFAVLGAGLHHSVPVAALDQNPIAPTDSLLGTAMARPLAQSRAPAYQRKINSSRRRRGSLAFTAYWNRCAGFVTAFQKR